LRRVGSVKTRVRSHIISVSHFVYVLCIDNKCKLFLQVFVYYFFINNYLLFDVFSVERKYNVKVSTGKRLCLVLLLMMMMMMMMMTTTTTTTTTKVTVDLYSNLVKSYFVYFSDI